jgi:enoyl-CoA hydratase/carnithine racemase
VIALEDSGEAGGGVVTLWLENPAQRNALTVSDLREVAARAMDDAMKDRALLIAGRGMAFCAGFDLKECQKNRAVLGDLLRSLSAAILALRARGTPVVLAAHGAAIAGGCALLGAADYVVADRAAKLGYPVVRLGLSPAVSAPFVRFCIPPGAARRLLLDPGLIDGAEAHRLGLVHELVDTPEQVYPAALAAARQLADKPPYALAATKSWLREIEAAPDAGTDGVARGLEASLTTASAEECAAALAALRL